MQPPLTTPRLHLRPATGDDAPRLQALWDLPEVRHYLFDDARVTAERAAETLAACLEVAGEGIGLWLVMPQGEGAAGGDGEPIGCAGLMPAGVVAEYEPRLAGLVEVVVALHPGAWGVGYAVEALRALVDHAFGTLGLERLAGVTDVPNQASARMLERAGFEVLSETKGPRHRLRHYLLPAGLRGCWGAEGLAGRSGRANSFEELSPQRTRRARRRTLGAGQLPFSVTSVSSVVRCRSLPFTAARSTAGLESYSAAVPAG